MLLTTTITAVDRLRKIPRIVPSIFRQVLPSFRIRLILLIVTKTDSLSHYNHIFLIYLASLKVPIFVILLSFSHLIHSSDEQANSGTENMHPTLARMALGL